MNDFVVIAMGPFYAAAVAATWYGLSYMSHMLRRVDQSATETVATETTGQNKT